MKYHKNRWLKITFIAFPLLITIAVFLYFSSHNEIPQRTISQPDITILSNPEGYYDNFKVEKISIVKRMDNRLFFSFSADRVVHRKRISKFFVYQNLKEILLSGVQIDFYPYNMRHLKNQNTLIPLDDIGSSFASLGKPSTPIEEYLAGKADIDLDLLSRILFEDLSINIYLPSDKKFSITAKFARVNTYFENIVLEGPVTIVDSSGKEMHASEAVWSKKFNGIYLPGGYILNNKQHNGKAFYTIDTKGNFSKVLKIPDIEYVDFIEEREKVLYAYISKNMPPYLRLMFGIPDKN
jgi:hypothetical protein